jgi:hypothetical protein
MTNREDTSSSVDDETRALVRGNHAPKKPTPASGDKFHGQIEREASNRRDGKGR